MPPRAIPVIQANGSPPPTPRLRRLLIPVAVVLVGASVVIVILVRMQGNEATSHPPALLGETQLRAAPRSDAEIVASLAANTVIDLLGRTDDGSWLIIVPESHNDPKGWVPLISIRNAGDLTALPNVTIPSDTAPPTQTAHGASPSPTLGTSRTATPTSTPSSRATGGADVRVQEMGSRSNRLLLVIANVGGASAPQILEVTVDNETPRRIDLGKQLTPGETAEIVLTTEYVQRRASVTVAVSTGGGAAGNGEARTATAVVSPDQPNDIELLPPSLRAGDGHLVVTMRNNSTIPLFGTATISVREPPPSNRLLARHDAPFDMQPSATLDVDFSDLRDLDPAPLRISISTDAITDADTGNNNYPR